MKLTTLADVRELLKHLPEGHRERSTWHHVAACLDEAAAGGDTIDVAVPLKMVLSMEGVPYQTLPAARTIEELDPGFVVKDSTEWKDWQSTGAWR
jgi:hypothetical protein